MATPKTWIASNVKMGTIRLSLNGTVLSAIQGYTFVDSVGEVIEELPARTIQKSIEFAELPTEIQTALVAINSFMYQSALIQEEMN